MKLAGVAWMVVAACSGNHAPRVSPGDIRAIRVTTHGSGLGRFPGYTIEVRATGDVVFTGLANVDAKGEHPAGTISSAVFGELAADVAELDFFSLRPRYDDAASGCRATWSDGGSIQVEVVSTSRSYTVDDYQGCDGAPRLDQLRALEQRVLNVVDTSALLRDSDPLKPVIPVHAEMTVVPAPSTWSVQLSRLRGTVSRCYQSRLERSHDLAGRLIVHVASDAQGTITSLEQQPGSWDDTEVVRCLEQWARLVKPVAAKPVIRDMTITFDLSSGHW